MEPGGAKRLRSDLQCLFELQCSNERLKKGGELEKSWRESHKRRGCGGTVEPTRNGLGRRWGGVQDGRSPREEGLGS
jgi:hypothetical protein